MVSLVMQQPLSSNSFSNQHKIRNLFLKIKYYNLFYIIMVHLIKIQLKSIKIRLTLNSNLNKLLK